LFYAGGFYYAVFGLCLLPFFVSLVFISDRLRNTLLEAVIKERDIALLASRFDTALNNMPHGLCMFDADLRVVVTNQRLREIFGLEIEIGHKGQTVRELLLYSVEAGTILRPPGGRDRGAPQGQGHHRPDYPEAGRPHAEPRLPVDGQGRLGRADRGRHRAQIGRSAYQPPRALRFTDRPAQPHVHA
jgi:PAS domain-containing protein